METTTVHSSQLNPEQTIEWRDDYEASINSSESAKVIWDGQAWEVIGIDHHFDMTFGKESYTFTLKR